MPIFYTSLIILRWWSLVLNELQFAHFQELKGKLAALHETRKSLQERGEVLRASIKAARDAKTENDIKTASFAQIVTEDQVSCEQRKFDTISMLQPWTLSCMTPQMVQVDFGSVELTVQLKAIVDDGSYVIDDIQMVVATDHCHQLSKLLWDSLKVCSITLSMQDMGWYGVCSFKENISSTCADIQLQVYYY